jgi:hypothetical protein
VPVQSRGKRWIVVGGGLALAVLLGAGVGYERLSRSEPPLPPLLQNAHVAGGLWHTCPPSTAGDALFQNPRELDLSPELTERLMGAFPPGSDEDRLLETLSRQGFEPVPSPCAEDLSVRAVVFRQHGTGFLSSPITANVFWGVDDGKKIIWTKGFVAFSGL